MLSYSQQYDWDDPHYFQVSKISNNGTMIWNITFRSIRNNILPQLQIPLEYIIWQFLKKLAEEWQAKAEGAEGAEADAEGAVEDEEVATEA